MQKQTTAQPKPAIALPQGVDPLWREKIAAANEASELGRELRKGKPIGFTNFVGTR